MNIEYYAMTIKMMSNVNKVEALLESDDELPMDYCEVPTTPAYQIDSRFDPIKFNWINNLNSQTDKIDNNTLSLNSELNEIQSCSNISYLVNKPIIKQGVLLKHDLFCLKSIEGLADDSTLIWLINFLLQKDLQSKYVFLKSCLVKNYDNETTNNFKKSRNTLITDKHNIVIEF